MKQNPLTVIANIKPAEKQELEHLLNCIGQNLETNEYLRFAEIETTHFARFAMIGGGNLADRDAKNRLLFTSNHDGPVEKYIDLLVNKAGKGMEAIWSKCEGCPDVKLTSAHHRQECKEYIKAHMVNTQAFYQGYPGYSVRDVKGYLECRQQLEEFLNLEEFEPLLGALAHLPPPQPGLLSGIGRFVADLRLKEKAIGVVFAFLEHVLGPKLSQEPPSGVSKEVDTRPEMTDSVSNVQNELTQLNPIDPRRLPALKRILKVMNLVATYNPTPGSLSGLATIHFARWLIIDDGATLLFESNYDGNWEQYIGDFVDKISGGMDAIWGNCIGYPSHGSKAIQGFKQAIIDHQVKAQVFYSAYPKDSVKNIRNDIEIGRKLSRFINQKGVADWLRRL